MKRILKRTLPIACFVAATMLCGAAPAADYAPLDCAKASSPAQKTVCADYHLGQQEARMATLFEWATSFVGMGQRGTIQDAQRAFIAAREACGGDVACLGAAYAKRIAELQVVMEDIRSRGPF